MAWSDAVPPSIMGSCRKSIFVWRMRVLPTASASDRRRCASLTYGLQQKHRRSYSVLLPFLTELLSQLVPCSTS
jgi:hypothetical protein